MSSVVQNLCRHSGSGYVARQIAGDDRTGAYAGSAVHGNVVHDVATRTDVYLISYMRCLRLVLANRCKLSDVYVVADDGMSVDDNAKNNAGYKDRTQSLPLQE